MGAIGIAYFGLADCSACVGSPRSLTAADCGLFLAIRSALARFEPAIISRKTGGRNRARTYDLVHVRHAL